jgi:hypothetical protein
MYGTALRLKWVDPGPSFRFFTSLALNGKSEVRWRQSRHR